ncbi:SapB/AmfS family lantipeptide [Nocardiopsis sp. CA-288880]
MALSDVLDLQAFEVAVDESVMLNSGLSLVGCSGDVITQPQ